MTAALSELNRSALGGREQYGFVHVAAIGYVAIIGGFSVAAWCSENEPFRAAMCAGAQVLAIVFAILARRAMTGQMPLAALLSGVGCGGCAWWAAQGIQHAWQSNGTAINMPMVVFLAAVEPGLFLLAEHIREGREALREAFKRDEAEQAETLREVRSRNAVRDFGAPVLAASGGVALAASPSAAALPALAAQPAPVGDPAAIVSTNVGYATAREHAIALKRSNRFITESAASELTGLPRSTIGKAWRENGLAGRTLAA